MCGPLLRNMDSAGGVVVGLLSTSASESMSGGVKQKGFACVLLFRWLCVPLVMPSWCLGADEAFGFC